MGFKKTVGKLFGKGGGGGPDYAQMAETARQNLNKAGVNTQGMSQSTLLSQYNNGYSLIAQRNTQTKEEYIEGGGSINGSYSSGGQASTSLLGAVGKKKKTLLGGYSDEASVLGG